MHSYVQDTSIIPNNTLTYTAGSVNTISGVPSETYVVAGAPATVPDTAHGQNLEFNRTEEQDGEFSTGQRIYQAVQNNEFAYSHDLGGTPVQSLVFSAPASPGSPYAAQIQIWDISGAVQPSNDPRPRPTGLEAQLWATINPVLTSGGLSTVIENADTDDPSVSIYNGDTFNAAYSFVGGEAGKPGVRLPAQFAIELLNGDGAVDYIPMVISDNCLPGDTLVEKMVEPED